MRQHTVPAGVPETSLKSYLTRAFPAWPSWLIRETLKKKDVRVNGAKSGAEAVVRAGDTLSIYVDDRYFEAPLQMIYEDDDWLVADKPAGVPVDSDGRGVGGDTMLARLKAHCPSARLCHRLDTGTGGVLIAAKNDRAEQAALRAFAAHDLVKLYRCIAVGQPPRDEARLTAYLLKDASASSVRILEHPAPGALSIETRYRLIEARDALSLLEVRLMTGRTHQIRAHLSYVGLPLLGDDKYGDREENRRWHVSQPQLWCVRISLLGHTFESRPRFSCRAFE